MKINGLQMSDMNRNKTLAGKTVSSNGLNITYDENGYAKWAVNYKHAFLQGTQKSVRAQSVDAVLNAAARADFTGSPYDKKYFSDKQIELVEELRREVAAGKMSQNAADQLIEEVRNKYGYSGGPSGNEYILLDYPKQPGEVVMEEQRAGQTAVASASTTNATGTTGATNDATTGETQNTALGEAVSVTAASTSSSAPQSSASSAQGAAGSTLPHVSEADAGRSQTMRRLYQQTLMQQQQHQQLQSTLEERRKHDLAQQVDRSRIADRLLRLLNDDEDDDEDDAQTEETNPMETVE